MPESGQVCVCSVESQQGVSDGVALMLESVMVDQNWSWWVLGSVGGGVCKSGAHF